MLVKPYETPDAGQKTFGEAADVDGEIRATCQHPPTRRPLLLLAVTPLSAQATLTYMPQVGYS